MNKKRKRKFTFTPCFHPDLSAEEFGKFKTAFISNYPKSGSLDEAVFCLFFSMLIDGVLPSNAPINFFYGIRLDRSDLKKKIIRMTRKNYASGIPIYLSSLSYVYLLNYLKKIKLAGFNTHELMPSQLFSKKEFQKKFRIWLSELGRLVNMNRTPSIKTKVGGVGYICLLGAAPPKDEAGTPRSPHLTTFFRLTLQTSVGVGTLFSSSS